MDELTTISKKWISSAKIDFIREGLMKGALGALIEMTGDATQGSFEEVVHIFDQLLSTPLSRKKIVRFSGRLTDYDPNFTLLVKSLFDHGFELQCVVGDRLVPSWMQWMHWVIVQTSLSVIMTTSDEVWYSPDEGGFPPDVTVPLRANRPTFCYVTGRVAKEDAAAFICRSKNHWCLL